VPVGMSLPNARVIILPLGFSGDQPVSPLPQGTTGEVFVTGPWLSCGYDQHWARTRDARVQYDGAIWHRTGDVGHVDNGVFIEGRTAHIVNTGEKTLTPVPLEQSVEALLPGVTAAAVGVPLRDAAALVIVLCDGKTTGAADVSIERQVREVAPDVVAVLFKKDLPVDRRHNSKIDRLALASWAADQLS
jgi:acyl-coenzyme A synthetase/AMP-(fatty) acid ligase